MIQQISVETEHYKGNYPDRCSIDSCDAPAALTEDLITGEFRGLKSCLRVEAGGRCGARFRERAEAAPAPPRTSG